MYETPVRSLKVNELDTAISSANDLIESSINSDNTKLKMELILHQYVLLSLYWFIMRA